MGGFDSQRLPLLAPYEAMRINRRDGWIIHQLFFDSVGMTSVFQVQRLAMEQGTVYVAAKGQNYIRGSDAPASIWLLLTPRTRNGFL
jgi:hypothetical protein